jgi:predicted TIM-barrel fold metal-dependent hydrolase
LSPGWRSNPARYFPADLVRAANSYLQDKVLFGTDYPLLAPDRWLKDFEALEFKPEAKARILVRNAIKVLGLA